MPTSSGSIENRLHPLRLQPDVMTLGGLARRWIRPRQAKRRFEGVSDRLDVERVDEHACLRRDEFRRPSNASGDHGTAAGHRLEE